MDRLMIGVSGVRGTIGGTLTPRIACDFAAAFGTMLMENRREPATLTLGRDTRPSGPMLRNAVAAGLMATGVRVIDLGVASTPGCALMTRRLGADGGVIITASHNPGEYNGLKFLQSVGTGLTAAAAGRLKELFESGAFVLTGSDSQGSESQNDDTHAAHVSTLCEHYDASRIAAGRFRVVLDSVNGAGCAVTPMLLERFGCRLTHINGEPTGRFAHPPEPVADNLGVLCRIVREGGADVGFAQDADADRLAIVDERGEFIGEEYTLALATAYTLRHRTGPVATNLGTTRMIDDIARAAGCVVLRTPTGEANVVEAMLAHECVFGGEGGGGAIDPRVVPVRDSLVGIACVLSHVAESGRTISQLVEELPRYHMLKTKLPCPADAAGEVARRTKAAFQERTDAEFNEADGLRIDLPEGWVLARPSNTEPILRVQAEAKERDQARKLLDRVLRIAREVVEAA